MASFRVDIESALFVALLVESESMSNRNQGVIISMNEKNALVFDVAYIIFRIDQVYIYFSFP